nr:MAG TPA: hypothetical protein [Caudoviricetes sp.]
MGYQSQLLITRWCNESKHPVQAVLYKTNVVGLGNS